MGLWPTLCKAFELRPVLSLFKAIEKRSLAPLLTLRRTSNGTHFELVATATRTAIRNHSNSFWFNWNPFPRLCVSTSFFTKSCFMGRFYRSRHRHRRFLSHSVVNCLTRISYFAWPCQHVGRVENHRIYFRTSPPKRRRKRSSRRISSGPVSFMDGIP